MTTAYVVPQTLVFQEFNLASQVQERDLPAHISGGHAHLVRYDEADEKADGLLGYYDRVVETDYAWPHKPSGSKIDPTYTKVFMDKALLKYFDDAISSGDNIQTVAGRSNRVRAEATTFVASEGFDRDASLFDRDVKLGDIVKVRAVVSAVSYTLWTSIRGFVAEVVAATVAAATAEAANHASQSAPGTTFEQTAGAQNCVGISGMDQSLYDGRVAGNLNETYTITVVEGSAGNDATTATLRVTSASGNDDVAEVTPSVFGISTPIGTRGLTVTWSDSVGAACSLSADNDGVSDDNFIPGQTWVVTCGQAYVAPVATSGGTYVGSADATYIVEVTKGGRFADSPEITVTTNKGNDVSGPTKVTATGDTKSIGTKGLTISFAGAGLCKGDKYYVVATAESAGAIQTLVLANNLPDEVVNHGATDVDLTLFIQKDIEVSQNRTGFAPIVNWSQTDDLLTIADGIVAYDSSWTDSGVELAMDVYSESTQGFGKLYVEYRAWQSLLCSELGQLGPEDDLDVAISGAIHPDNPLKYGVFKARQNANDTPVTYTSVCDPSDVDSWENVLDVIDGHDGVYSLVPLTRDAAVLSLFEAHVNAQSTPSVGRWRKAFFNLPGIPDKAIVDATLSSDGDEVLATLKDDPNTSGTQYTLLRVPARNGKFVTNGVRAGDVVRFLYTTDGFGTAVYSEFTVDEVLSEDELLLETGHSAAITVAQKVEVWRTLTATEEAEALAIYGGYSNRRVCQVWPDTIGADGRTVEGYFLCAALAGLASGVVPHQGLTRLEIAGFDTVKRTTTKFNASQLNIMAAGGVWIVSQDLATGKVFSRHAITTADYDDINAREEMVVRNVDSISYQLGATYEPYIGVSNVTDTTIAVLYAETENAIRALKSSNFVERLGTQLLEGTKIQEISKHPTLKDRIRVVLTLVIPYSLNNLEVHLVI